MKIFSLINEIINKNYNSFRTYLLLLAHSIFYPKKYNLPDRKKKKYDEIQYFKQINLIRIAILECHEVLKIIYKKEAWDFAGVILLKLIKEEKDKKSKFNLNYNLFSSYCRLKKYKEAVQLGEKLLKENSIDTFLDEEEYRNFT